MMLIGFLLAIIDDEDPPSDPQITGDRQWDLAWSYPYYKAPYWDDQIKKRHMYNIRKTPH